MCVVCADAGQGIKKAHPGKGKLWSTYSKFLKYAIIHPFPKGISFTVQVPFQYEAESLPSEIKLLALILIWKDLTSL